MAITLSGSVQYLSRTSTPITGTPATISVWANAATTAVAQCIATIGAGTNVYFLIGLSSALNKWYIAARNASTEFYAPSTTAPATSTWVNVVGVFESSTSRIIYVNGVNENNNTSSVTPTLTKIGIGVRVDGASIPSGSPSYFNGSLAEVGMWDIALGADDITALSKGMPPSLVCPNNLQIYCPLINTASANIDIVGAPFSTTGSITEAAHPRVYSL